jgi:2-hydroxymuconate-semialdehyde hydrolase
VTNPAGNRAMVFTDRYVDFKGLKVHIIEAGSGMPILMMHGVGPGTSVEGNFAPIIGPLAERYRIIGVDLVGFGKSRRKPSPPYFDFPLWFEQVKFVLDSIEGPEVGLIGHSLSGALALKLAARGGRVNRVLTTGCAGRSFPVNSYLDRVWTFPETREQLRVAMSGAMWEKAGLTDAFLDDRLEKLDQPGYREYFAQLFPPDRQSLIDSWAIDDAELARIDAKVLMIHGRDDLPIPYRHTTATLAPKIAKADTYLVARCGHSPSIEHPATVLGLARLLFG